MGIFSDNDGNKIAFSGSMNESTNAFNANYEAIDVFCNWISSEENERVEAKEKAFSRIWSNIEKNITIINFPELSDEIINKYKRKSLNLNIDIEEQEQEVNIVYRIIQLIHFLCCLIISNFINIKLVQLKNG